MGQWTIIRPRPHISHYHSSHSAADRKKIFAVKKYIYSLPNVELLPVCRPPEWSCTGPPSWRWVPWTAPCILWTIVRYPSTLHVMEILYNITLDTWYFIMGSTTLTRASNEPSRRLRKISQFHSYVPWVNVHLAYCLKCESDRRCFQLVEGPSWGLLRDSFEALSTTRHLAGQSLDSAQEIFPSSGVFPVTVERSSYCRISGELCRDSQEITFLQT